MKKVGIEKGRKDAWEMQTGATETRKEGGGKAEAGQGNKCVGVAGLGGQPGGDMLSGDMSGFDPKLVCFS